MKFLAITFLFMLLTASTCKQQPSCVEKLDPACTCIAQYDPVCGCSSKTYGNACQAECAGIKTYTKGECPQANKPLLEGTTWQLTKFAIDPMPQDVPTNIKIKLRFEADKITGNGGCNSIGGNYTVKGDSLTISNIFSTKMYCEEGSKWETMFLSRLEKSRTYILNNEDVLDINCGDLGKLIFKKNNE
jgi:heat shock protein HslJ